MSNSKDRVQKMLTFPTAMYSVLEKRAEAVGLNTPEYIRYLVLDDIRSNVFNVPAMIQAINEAKEEYRLGRTTSIKTKKELKDRYAEIVRYARSRK